MFGVAEDEETYPVPCSIPLHEESMYIDDDHYRLSRTETCTFAPSTVGSSRCLVRSLFGELWMRSWVAAIPSSIYSVSMLQHVMQFS